MARARRDRRDRRLVVVAGTGLVVLAAWLIPLRLSTPGGTEPAGGPAAPPTTSPVVPAPTAPERLDPVPRAGAVTVQPGPLADQVALSDLRLTRSPLASVTGSARLAGDEPGGASIGLRVDFYDRQGRRLGGAVQVLRQPAAFALDPDGRRRPLPFAISPAEPLRGVAAALVTVTAVVTE